VEVPRDVVDPLRVFECVIALGVVHVDLLQGGKTKTLEQYSYFESHVLSSISFSG
jgi:hypothetical protein